MGLPSSSLLPPPPPFPTSPPLRGLREQDRFFKGFLQAFFTRVSLNSGRPVCNFGVKKLTRRKSKRNTHTPGERGGEWRGEFILSKYWVANALLVTSSLTNFRKLFWMLITPFAHSVRIRKIRFRKQTWILLARPRDCLLWRLLDYFTLRWCKIHLKIEILRRWL